MRHLQLNFVFAFKWLFAKIGKLWNVYIRARNPPNRHVHMYIEINSEQLLKRVFVSCGSKPHLSIITAAKTQQNNGVP